ncbi:hypothetical protein POM88_050188 [Heracleum sosnowskyi]|uniref:Uncharacterized protein n=1 Tax=Heracleum sosnowskyi TaxID=360622 RepID=A0AAD8GX44_9APIA|nr:hypothetical protein POM88_050188 [Heracleum sosnowskyi]
MKEVATEKGFDSIAHHLIHLTNENQQQCRIIYHNYLKVFNCEGKSSKNCEVLRSHLVAWCGATRNHKTLHSYPEKYEITAKYLGMTLYSILFGYKIGSNKYLENRWECICLTNSAGQVFDEMPHPNFILVMQMKMRVFFVNFKWVLLFWIRSRVPATDHLTHVLKRRIKSYW